MEQIEEKPLEQNSLVHEENIKIEIIFLEDQISSIWTASNPLEYVFELLETQLRKKTGRIDYDNNYLYALSEFHINNLIFIKTHFQHFPDQIVAKVLNLLNELLNLKDSNRIEARKSFIMSNNKLNSIELDEHSEKEKVSKKLNIQKIEPDFLDLGKKKLNDIKKGLAFLELIPTRPLSTKSNIINNDSYFLKNNEIIMLLNYIRDFYFPYIKLYYHFANVERVTETKTIDVIINKPLFVQPLNFATLQIPEKAVAENEETKNEEKKAVNNMN
jgi:hypothetical protein